MRRCAYFCHLGRGEARKDGRRAIPGERTTSEVTRMRGVRRTGCINTWVMATGKRRLGLSYPERSRNDGNVGGSPWAVKSQHCTENCTREAWQSPHRFADRRDRWSMTTVC
jgi:hypothetical protein